MSFTRNCSVCGAYLVDCTCPNANYCPTCGRRMNKPLVKGKREGRPPGLDDEYNVCDACEKEQENGSTTGSVGGTTPKNT